MALRRSQICAESQDGATMAYGAASLQDGYPDMRMKVAIVAGTEDMVVDVGRHAVRLHDDIQGSELRLVPGAGPLVPHAVPGLIAGLVEAVFHRWTATQPATRVPAYAGT